MEACEIPEEVGNGKAGVGVEMTAARDCFLTRVPLGMQGCSAVSHSAPLTQGWQCHWLVSHCPELQLLPQSFQEKHN